MTSRDSWKTLTILFGKSIRISCRLQSQLIMINSKILCYLQRVCIVEIRWVRLLSTRVFHMTYYKEPAQFQRTTITTKVRAIVWFSVHKTMEWKELCLKALSLNLIKAKRKRSKSESKLIIKWVDWKSLERRWGLKWLQEIYLIILTSSVICSRYLDRSKLAKSSHSVMKLLILSSFTILEEGAKILSFKISSGVTKRNLTRRGSKYWALSHLRDLETITFKGSIIPLIWIKYKCNSERGNRMISWKRVERCMVLKFHAINCLSNSKMIFLPPTYLQPH